MKLAKLALLLPLVAASPFPQHPMARDDAVAAPNSAAPAPTPVQAAPQAEISGQSPVGAEPSGVEALKALVKRRLPQK